MERRRELRFIEDLPVRVWVIDERGRWLTQFAVAHDISRGGALLMGLDHLLRCGDLILVEYDSIKTRFRIVWIRDSEGPYKIQAAVQAAGRRQLSVGAGSCGTGSRATALKQPRIRTDQVHDVMSRCENPCRSVARRF